MKLRTLFILILLGLALFGCWYAYSSYEQAQHHHHRRPHATEHTAPIQMPPSPPSSPSRPPLAQPNVQPAQPVSPAPSVTGSDAASIPGAKVMSNGDVCFYGALPQHVGSDDLYPDPKLTPGCVRPAEAFSVLCEVGHSDEERHTTEAMKEEVFDRYHIPVDQRHGPNGESLYEIDHFIPLVIGGADRVENLFPQRYLPHPGARDKDTVERYLRDAVCKRQDKPQLEAQLEIRNDWYAVWQEWNSHRRRH